MPKPAINCCCSSCDCQLCVLPTGCGGMVEFDWGVYSGSTCTGSALFTGHAALGGSPCVCLPGAGTYAFQITPAGVSAGLWRPRCVLIVVTDDDCAAGKNVAVRLSPYQHDVTIRAFGCCDCLLPGMSVSYSDGTDTGTGTTGLDGTLVLTGLNAPADPDGSTATITVAGKCGYSTKTVYVPVDVCSMPVDVTLEVDSNHVCIRGLWPVHKTQTYVGAKAGSIALHWQDTGSTCGGPQTFLGCGSYTAGDAATPVVCTDDLYEAGDQYRYQSGGASVPVVIVLTLQGTCCTSTTIDGVVVHRHGLLWDLVKVIPMAGPCECGSPSTDGYRLVGQGWCYVPGGGFGVTATATTITLDASCNLGACAYASGTTFPAAWGYDEGLGRCVHTTYFYERLAEYSHYTGPGTHTTDTEASMAYKACDECWTGQVLSSTTDINQVKDVGFVEPGSPWSPTAPSVPAFVEGYSITLA